MISYTNCDEFWPNECTTETCPLPVCPDCSLVDCHPNLHAEECREFGFDFAHNLVGGGCCPACVTYLEKGDVCKEESENARPPPEILIRSYKLPCTNISILDDL